MMLFSNCNYAISPSLPWDAGRQVINLTTSLPGNFPGLDDRPHRSLFCFLSLPILHKTIYFERRVPFVKGRRLYGDGLDGETSLLLRLFYTTGSILAIHFLSALTLYFKTLTPTLLSEASLLLRMYHFPQVARSLFPHGIIPLC